MWPHTTDWIIDSGASDHITTSFSLLTDHVPIGSLIHLPKGQTFTISHKGTIHLTPDIILFNVLYVPQFKYNLLSGSKLASQSNYCLIFYPNICVFQDLLHRKLRGIGKLDGGLYKLCLHTSSSPNTVALMAYVSRTAVHWHNILRHFPISSLSSIPSILCNKYSGSHDDFMRDVCHYAKQTRLPFPISSTHNTYPCSLLHCDIWGPYKHHTMNGCH